MQHLDPVLADDKRQCPNFVGALLEREASRRPSGRSRSRLWQKSRPRAAPTLGAFVELSNEYQQFVGLGIDACRKIDDGPIEFIDRYELRARSCNRFHGTSL